MSACIFSFSASRRFSDVNFSSKRARYTQQQKVDVIKSTKHLTVNAAMKLLHVVSGCEKIQASQIRKWRKKDFYEDDTSDNEHQGKRRKLKAAEHGGGPKVDIIFERKVLDELVYATLKMIDGKQKAGVLVNVAFSHAVIRIAARKVQLEEPFASDRKLRQLKFRRTWIHGWLRRHALRRKRITATEKDLPDPDVVHASMAEIQDVIRGKGYTLAETINADKTGIFFGAPPKYQYIPSDASRALAPGSDEKSRFTMMLFGSAAGEMGPPWAIIRCAAKGTDLINTRVLHNIHLQPGFIYEEGWELRLWQSQVPTDDRTTAACKRPYLIHLETLRL